MKEVLELFKAKESVISQLREFCNIEYEHDTQDDSLFIKENLKDDFKFLIASTEWHENENFTVEVYFDVRYLALRKYLYGENGLSYVEPTWYKSIESAIESIKSYEFDSLTVFEESTDWLRSKLSCH
ncbi:hypothetical protein [Staphylococcus shinii]|uniref:hypothetical protein n=1 Tax=Staphylococcus shinii TaxID=2912228 RepID=UPI003EE94512